MEEEEFIPLLDKKSGKFFSIGNMLVKTKNPGEELLSYFKNVAHNLESFMDEPYKVRGNQAFVYFGELTASLRWFGKAAVSLKHILNRYNSYNIPESEEEKTKFLNEAEKNFDFYFNIIKNLYLNLKKEAKHLGLTRATTNEGIDINLETEIRDGVLPQNIYKDYSFGEEERLLGVVFKYVSTTHTLEEIIQNNKIEEGQIEEVMGSFHRIQSGGYDTYIKGTELEEKDSRIKPFRGYISMCLHLGEIATDLLHFYERHENKIRHGETREKIAKIVNPPKLFGHVKNFAVHYLEKYSLNGRKLADSLLEDYANMVFNEEKVIIPKGSVLHLRSAACLVKPVVESKKPFLMYFDKEKIDCSSVLSIICAFGEIAGVVKERGVEMTLHGDKEIVKEVKKNFLNSILEKPH